MLRNRNRNSDGTHVCVENARTAAPIGQLMVMVVGGR